jgi:LPXTG-motif cell wall-anchored protein
VRTLATLLLLLGALALAVPAATLASGGGSAGDQQYTDPFANTPAPSTHTTTHTAPVTPAPAPAPTPAAPATSTVPSSTPTVSAATTAAADPTTPTATTANTLPRTGYDSRLAGAAGLALTAAGLLLRARLRRG